jgi:hypothetical protein
MPSEAEKLKLESAWKVHTYLNEYIRFADQKAGVFLAFQGGLLTALFTAKLHHDVAAAPFGSWPTFCATVGFIFLPLGACFALFAVAPRLPTAAVLIQRYWPWAKIVSPPPPGIIYWEQILGHEEAASYSAALNGRGATEWVDAVAQHAFVLASVASKKFKWVNRSWYCSAIPAVLSAWAIFVRSA